MSPMLDPPLYNVHNNILKYKHSYILHTIVMYVAQQCIITLMILIAYVLQKRSADIGRKLAVSYEALEHNHR